MQIGDGVNIIWWLNVTVIQSGKASAEYENNNRNWQQISPATAHKNEHYQNLNKKIIFKSER